MSRFILFTPVGAPSATVNSLQRAGHMYSSRPQAVYYNASKARMLASSRKERTALLKRQCTKKSEAPAKPSDEKAITPVKNEKVSVLHTVMRLLVDGWQLLKRRVLLLTGQRKQLALRVLLFALGMMVISTYHHVLVNPSVTTAYWLPFGDGRLSVSDILGMGLFYVALEPATALLLGALKALRLMDNNLEYSAVASNALLPLRSLGWVFALLVAFDAAQWMNVSQAGTTTILNALSPNKVRRVAIVALCSIMLDWVKGMFMDHVIFAKSANQSKERMREERGEYVLLSKGVSAVIAFAAVCSFAAIVGVPLSALTTFGGLSTLAFTFASREVLKDLYAGSMLYVFKPFLEKDTILLPGFESKGRIMIEKIGWLHTRARMWDSNEVVIPNSHLFGAKVINTSLRTAGHFNETVHIRYSDLARIQPLIDEIEALLSTDSRVNSSAFEPMVEAEQLSSSGIEIRFQAWLFAKTHREMAKVSSALLVKVAQCISASGCDFSFPRFTIETTNPAITSPPNNSPSSTNGTTNTPKSKSFPCD